MPPANSQVSREIFPDSLLVGALGQPQVVFCEGIVGAGREFFRQVCALGLEGVVAKRLDSR